MDKEDTKYYNDFRREKALEGAMCELCGRHQGCRAHHVFRRKKGANKILIWLCLECDSPHPFLGAHGNSENLLRPVYCKVIIENRPELRNYIFDYKPKYADILKMVRK